MKTAERAGRFICAAAAAAGFILLILPLWGIRVNVVLSGSMEPAIPTGGIVFTDTRQTAMYRRYYHIPAGRDNRDTQSCADREGQLYNQRRRQ